MLLLEEHFKKYYEVIYNIRIYTPEFPTKTKLIHKFTTLRESKYADK